MHQERICDLINGWTIVVLGFMIKRDLTKMTLNISQPYLITKMTQEPNKDMKSIMTFNTLTAPYKGIVSHQETNTKASYGLQNRYRSVV